MPRRFVYYVFTAFDEFLLSLLIIIAIIPNRRLMLSTALFDWCWQLSFSIFVSVFAITQWAHHTFMCRTWCAVSISHRSWGYITYGICRTIWRDKLTINWRKNMRVSPRRTLEMVPWECKIHSWFRASWAISQSNSPCVNFSTYIWYLFYTLASHQRIWSVCDKKNNISFTSSLLPRSHGGVRNFTCAQVCFGCFWEYTKLAQKVFTCMIQLGYVSFWF